MSRIRNARWIIPTATAVGIAWGYASLAQDPDTGKKVGEKIDDVVQEIKGGLKKAGSAAKDEFSKARAAINNMGVESRVYGRLHWDRSLNDATIELASTDDGVITLKGSVADAKAKTKAVELARETVGVTKVVDELGVRPASATPSAPR